MPIVHKKQFAFCRARRCKRPHSTSDELTEHDWKAFEANLFLHQWRGDAQSGRSLHIDSDTSILSTKTTRGLTTTLGRHVRSPRTFTPMHRKEHRRRRMLQPARRAVIIAEGGFPSNLPTCKSGEIGFGDRRFGSRSFKYDSAAVKLAPVLTGGSVFNYFSQPL